MLLLQARQLLAQLAFFLFGHCHRRFCRAPAGSGRGGRYNYRVFHKPFKRRKILHRSMALPPVIAAAGGAVYRRACAESGLDLAAP